MIRSSRIVALLIVASGCTPHAMNGPDVAPAGKAPTSMGFLAPEKIQQVVRQGFGPFAACYEAALPNNPKLQGRVVVRFTIEPDGGVSNPVDGGSDIPDAGVTACVVKGFSSLRFPHPDGGVVSVVYPIMFKPGD